MSRTTPATRTCVYRAYTRDDRYDNSRMIDALTHCHYQETDSDRRVSERMRAELVPSFGGGPFLAIVASSRSRITRRVRERSGLLLLRGSASLKSSIYLSIFITARSLLLSPFVSPRSLFFSLCLSPLPPYLSGFPLRAVSPFRRSVSRARARARQ